MAHCRQCGAPLKANKSFCTVCGAKAKLAAAAPQALPPMPLSTSVSCAKCGAPVPAGKRFCTTCGVQLGAVEGKPVERAARFSAVQSRSVQALLLGLVIPGAGQAYNGQPVKGFFLLFASAFILPYFYSLYDAYTTAARMAVAGGPVGRGGLVWVVLQAWLALNVALLVAILLTLMGVLV